MGHRSKHKQTKKSHRLECTGRHEPQKKQAFEKRMFPSFASADLARADAVALELVKDLSFAKIKPRLNGSFDLLLYKEVVPKQAKK